MKTFVSPTPDRQVGSLLMIGILGGLPQEQIMPLLEKHGLPAELKPDEWYPLQDCLDLLQEVAEGDLAGMSDFVSIGINIATHAPFPPEINNLVTALQALNMVYHSNLPDADKSEGWQVEQVSTNHIVARNSSCFPGDLEYGIAYGTTRRFCPEGKRFIVKREELPNEDWEFHILLEDV